VWGHLQPVGVEPRNRRQIERWPSNRLVLLDSQEQRLRIEFKLGLLAYKFLFNQAPRYRGPLVRVADLSGRRALHSAKTDSLLVPSVKLPSAKPFQSLHLVHGTICQTLLNLLSHCIFYGASSRFIFFSDPFRTLL